MQKNNKTHLLFSRDQNGQSERKKVSYWLEKLFNQEQAKENRIIEEQTKIQNSIPPSLSDTQQTENMIEEKGQEDAVKHHAEKVERNRQAVADMVTNSNRILLKASAVFPWEFFPTRIIVEETRVTIIHRQLFSSQVHSINITDISNIFIDTGILFARLTIISNTFAQNQIIINLLWKKEAILVRRLIEGLRMFINKDINTTNYSVAELISKLKELSTTDIVL